MKKQEIFLLFVLYYSKIRKTKIEIKKEFGLLEKQYKFEKVRKEVRNYESNRNKKQIPKIF